MSGLAAWPGSPWEDGGPPPPARGGWVSREPVVAGVPVPRFEPLPVSREYRRAPYRPDTVLDGWSAGGFCVRGGSVRSVGDSGAWLLSGAGYRRVAGGKADADGISSSAVSALPRAPRDISPVRVALPAGEVLLPGTDGFGDPLGSGTGQVGRLFAGLLLTGPPSLTEFGHALDFSRETFDDDRALIAIWHRGQGST